MDFQDLDVSSVKVDGREAGFEQVDATPRLSADPEVTQPMKLVVDPDPSTRPKKGGDFIVVVTYSGTPEAIVDTDTSQEGWIRACYPLDGPQTCDGAFVVNEPIGAQSWFPSNNYPTRQGHVRHLDPGAEGQDGAGRRGEHREHHPRRRHGDVALARGRPDRHLPHDSHRRRLHLHGGQHDRDVDRADAAGVQRGGQYRHDGAGRGHPGSRWTRLPGSSTTSAICTGRTRSTPAVRSPTGRPASGTPSRCRVSRTTPVSYDTGDPSIDVSTQLHELAHQWFGNAVTLQTWADIWFNEGWAYWSELVLELPDAGWRRPGCHLRRPVRQ